MTFLQVEIFQMPGRWLTSDFDGIRNDVLRILTAYNIPPQLPTVP
jgi:hypothetical protein